MLIANGFGPCNSINIICKSVIAEEDLDFQNIIKRQAYIYKQNCPRFQKLSV